MLWPHLLPVSGHGNTLEKPNVWGKQGFEDCNEFCAGLGCSDRNGDERIFTIHFNRMSQNELLGVFLI
jgi:hypothetical protein